MPNTSPVAHTWPAALNVQLTHALRPSIFTIRERSSMGWAIGAGFK
jgi:hypothetical protein